jgi:asparagine synthase (glutamine-hydrolysing)
MCGIAGYRVLTGDPAPWHEGLPKATETLNHRGPDDSGLWHSPDNAVGFGQRRLSILDLSPLGHQPMISACGQWVMVFNGEVYNFREIRAQLEGLGHRFAGSGDSEVVLAAFAQWGPDAVKRFIGMFAIALWHRATSELHLLRDRLGVKPLYYRWDSRSLCFGSELKALRAFKHWAPEVEPDAVLDFFRYGYISHPRSIYRDVFKVPPAHRLVLKAQGAIELHRYWTVLDQVGSREGVAEDDLADELEALLISASKYRMIADVPVGVFLSGGIDSSLVTALLQKYSGKQIQTFTIGFAEAGFDETAHAEAVARHLGTSHKTRRLTASESMRILPGWGDLYDEPLADPAGIPSLLVSRVAAEDVKVVLSADGGDELFAGYDTYTSVLSRLQKLRRIPSSLRGLTSAALSQVPWDRMDEHLAQVSWPSQLSQQVRSRTTLPAIAIRDRINPQADGSHFDRAVTHFSDRELNLLLGRAESTRDSCEAFPGSVGERMCQWDLMHYLPEAIMTKVDRATMATSIEGREPLLDHRVAEFAFSIPFNLRQGALGPKHLLRKILYRHVPQAIVDRPKQGFSVPLGPWFAGELRSLPRQVLDPAKLRRQGLLNSSYVESLLTRLTAGDPLAVHKVWLLMAFQMWHARWME